MHLNSSGGESVMNEKAVLLQKQGYNILPLALQQCSSFLSQIIDAFNRTTKNPT